MRDQSASWVKSRDIDWFCREVMAALWLILYCDWLEPIVMSSRSTQLACTALSTIGLESRDFSQLNHGGSNTSGFKSRWRVFTMVCPDTNQRSSIKPRLMKPFLDQSDMVMDAHRQNTTFWKRSFPRSAFKLVRPQDEGGLDQDDHCTRKSWKIRYKGLV